VDDSSLNYLAGGPTTKADVLDFSFALSKGGTTSLFTSSTSILGTLDLTYSATLEEIVGWDISVSNLLLDAFTGNNVSGVGFAQWLILASSENVAVQYGGNLTPVSSIAPSAVPVPAALPLLAAGLGALGLMGRRKKRKIAAA
jgi:hypothetical protein